MVIIPFSSLLNFILSLTIITFLNEWEKLKNYFKESPSKCGRRAVELLNQKASIGWTTGSHTGSPVMVYAVGAGAENFSGLMDNTDIPKRISSLIQ